MKSLTLCVITCRNEPQYDWMIESLLRGTTYPDGIRVLAIDLFAHTRPAMPPWFRVEHPMPNPWQGEHRQTTRNFWAKATALNTAICLADSEWIAFVDDRSALSPRFIEAIQDAMNGQYAVCGTYEKRINLEVHSGHVFDGEVTGTDPRATGKMTPRSAPGSHWFGCCNALPLEWALQVNGYDEASNGMGYEDTPFGMMLHRSNYPIRFDERMAVIQDRTPKFSQPVITRVDPGVSPNDKSHALLKRLENKTRSTNGYDIRELRSKIQSGDKFPIPPPNQRDWYTGQLLSEI